MTNEHKISLQELRDQVERNITLSDATSRVASDRLHKTWVWDASCLPGKSHYLPVYLDIIDSLQRSGKLAVDRHILVETTTGSSGAAASCVARALGYSIIIFMP